MCMRVFLLQSIFIKRATNDLDQSRPATCAWTLLPRIKQAEPWRNLWSGARRPCMFKNLQSGRLQSWREPTATAVAGGRCEKQLWVGVCSDKHGREFKQWGRRADLLASCMQKNVYMWQGKSLCYNWKLETANGQAMLLLQSSFSTIWQRRTHPCRQLHWDKKRLGV